mmetsp:Transcript_47059/g.152514  ORF Transcript_47059/g.152514 Transcript_47059/m.152514 type:complete len:291 (+) Transcript_47059:252-1124(+)
MVSTLRQHCALPASDVTLPWRASHAHSFWRRQPLCHPARDEPLPKEHGRRRGVHVGHRACRQPEGRLDLWHALLEVPPHEDERGRARRVQQRLEGKPPRDAVEEPPRVSKPGAALPLLPARREALPRRLRRRLLCDERLELREPDVGEARAVAGDGGGARRRGLGVGLRRQGRRIRRVGDRDPLEAIAELREGVGGVLVALGRIGALIQGAFERRRSGGGAALAELPDVHRSVRRPLLAHPWPHTRLPLAEKRRSGVWPVARLALGAAGDPRGGRVVAARRGALAERSGK